MARDRYDDEDYEDDDRPRRRRDEDDDDFDDRPSRRGGGNLSGMDGFLNNTAVAILLALFSFCCCPLLGLILGGIGVATCKNPDSKRNAIIVLVAGAIGAVVGVILNLSGAVDPNKFGK